MEKFQYEEMNKRLVNLELSIATILFEMRSNHKDFLKTETEFKTILQKYAHTIYGNGDEEHSLVWGVKRNTEFRQFWQKFGWLILAGFAGIPCTVIAGIFLYLIKGT